jgi:hypothetical protein
VLAASPQPIARAYLVETAQGFALAGG